MIRINLAKKQGKGGAGGGLDLKNFKLSNLVEMLKSRGEEGGPKFDLNNPIVRAAAAVAVAWYFGNYLDDLKAAELKKVEVEMAKIEKEKDGVAQRLAKIKGWEPIKKQLEDDEKAIRIKLGVVKKLLDGRDAPSKMMMQVAQTIPDHVWLTGLEVNDDGVKFAGETASYNDVSDFMKGLDSTSQFSDIALSGIQEQAGEAKEGRVQSFELKAKRRASE